MEGVTVQTPGPSPLTKMSSRQPSSQKTDVVPKSQPFSGQFQTKYVLGANFSYLLSVSGQLNFGHWVKSHGCVGPLKALNDL